MTDDDDPYRVLGLDRMATAEEVRQAYFRLVRLYTPEAHPEEFKRVRAAYEALRSPLRRAELALLAFDEAVGEIDLDLVAHASDGDFDVAAVLLAAELSASDLTQTDFSHDMTALTEQDLLRPSS